MGQIQRVVVGLGLLATSAAFAGSAQVAAGPLRESVDDIPALVERVKNTVVNVEVTTRVGRGSAHELQVEEFWNRLFDGDMPRRRDGPPRQQFQRGIGSGFIISREGLVVTNNHVVGDADTIRVKLVDGRIFDATVIGRDPLTDVALIKISSAPNDLSVARLADSDALRVGEWVVAIGNPFGLASSVSAGIISARARDIGAGPYDEFLQTDAAINLGNSGGPLFNLRGEVVGINTAIVGGAASIGFAVPSNLFRAILPQLEKTGSVTRGFLGVGVQDLTPELARALKIPAGTTGAVINDVADDSPGKAAGLKPDDVIIEVDGEKVLSAGTMSRKVALKRPGATAQLVFYRNGKREERRVTWGTRPTTTDQRQPAPSGNGNGDANGTLGRMGMQLRPVDPAIARQLGVAAEGALVIEVTPGSPADNAGLQPGMVIVEAGGQRIRAPADLVKALKGAKSGTELLLRAQIPGGKILRVLPVP